MSLELGFWVPEGPISSTDASASYAALDGVPASDADATSPLQKFYEEVLAEFPADGEVGRDRSVWNALPENSGTYVRLSVRHSKQKDVSAFLWAVADFHGVTSYDAGLEIVRSPAARGGSLETADGRVVQNSTPKSIGRALDGLTDDDWFMICKINAVYFMQIAFGPAVLDSPERYLVEVRNGPRCHVGVRCDDRDLVLDALVRYMNRDLRWMSEFAFEPVLQ